MRHTIDIARIVVVTALLGLSGLAGGCSYALQVPDRFLVTQNEWWELRALTPEESKLWIREFKDDDKGSLSFWSEALKSDLLKSRGYTLVEEGPIKDASGREGLALVLETSLSGRPVRELMAVFVIPGWCDHTIRVVEYVADKEAFVAEVDGVRASVATLR